MKLFIKKHCNLLKIILYIILYSLLPAVGLIYYMSFGQREIALQNAKKEINYIVKEIYLNEQEIISKTETLLFTLSQYPSLKTLDKKNCNEFLSAMYKKTSFFTNIFAADIQGNVFCSALPSKNPINIADRKYFINTVANRKFSLGDYQLGRLTKKPVWVAAYPVFNKDDVLVGIVAASIDLQWLSDLLSEQKLPPRSILRIFDDKGIILGSYPNKNEIGARKINSPEIAHVVSGKESPVELKGLDNINRIYAYAEFKPSAIDEKKFILIGVEKSFVEQPVNEVFRKTLTLALFITFLVIFIAIVNWRLFVYPEIKPEIKK